MDEFEINIDEEEVVPQVKPSLYDINQSFDVIKTDRYCGIKGEYEARMVLFTNFILGEKCVILKGSRASGKCLIGDTTVLNSCGEYIPIRDIEQAVNKDKAYKVKTINKHMKIENKPVVAFENNQKRKVYKITTRSRRTITMTANHPMLQYDGAYKSIDNGLCVGDALLIPKTNGMFGNTYSVDEPELLAYVIAEGGLTGNDVRFTNDDRTIVRDYKKKLRAKFNMETKKYGITYIARNPTDLKRKKYEKTKIKQWLGQHNLMGKYSYEKEIPPMVFSYDRDSTSRFLKCLFSCDGSIYNKKNGSRYTRIIEYCSSSPTLIQQVQQLLDKFGIISRIRQKKTKCRPTNILTIYTNFNQKYLEEIGFIGRKANVDGNNFLSMNVDCYPKSVWVIIYQEMKNKKIGWKRLGKSVGYNQSSLRNGIKYRPHQDKLKLINHILDSPLLDELIKMNDLFFFDEIVNIEYVGKKETFNLETQDNHTFIANGFVSHNTNLIDIAGAYAKNPVVLASSSEKAFQRNSGLNNASHFIVPEVNKIHEKTFELLKDFGEGAKHYYTFLNALKEPESILLDPKPFVTSIADENKNANELGDELLSRLTVIRTDSSVTQNVAVVEEKLKRAENPFYKKGISQDKVKKCLDYVKGLPSIVHFGFVYPAGTVIRSAIPTLFTDSRRDTEKYLYNTYGITLFYYYDRIKRVFDGKDYLFVTPVDMWLNNIIYKNILIESSLKCGKIEQEILDILTIFGNEVKNDDWGNKVKGLKITDIHTELLRRSYTPTIDSVKKYCNQLSETGYIIRNEEVRPFRFSLNPELHREYKVRIDWGEVVEACKASISKNFPEVADEYISRFCEGKGLECVHPFTGETINILVDKVVGEESEVVTESEEQKVVKPEAKREEQVVVVGVDDEKDVIQREVLEILEDREAHSFVELASGHSDDLVTEVVGYLVTIGEILREGNDKYRVLR
jgi:intein/homing endonuclease